MTFSAKERQEIIEHLRRELAKAVATYGLNSDEACQIRGKLNIWKEASK